MVSPESTTTLVVGRRRFDVHVGATESPRSLRVTIVADSSARWTFDQPGWRPLELGTGAHGAHVWSAREVITLPAQIGEAPAVSFVVDEDLLGVFADQDGWTLVCETSVRRCVDGRERQRIELGGVVESFSWTSDDTLSVRLDDGPEIAVAVGGAQLRDIAPESARDAGRGEAPSASATSPIVLPQLTLIGYWTGEFAPGWPDPADFVDDTRDTHERDSVADYLGRGFVVRAYMGFSPCRLCGKDNGCLELSDGTYVWPEGLAHYVVDHDVRLPERFVAHALAMAEAYETSDRDESWWRGSAA